MSKRGDKWVSKRSLGGSRHVPSLSIPARARPDEGAILMFLGRHAHAIDAKGRLAVPARSRDALGEGVDPTGGVDRSLSLYPIGAWLPLAEKVTALPNSDPDARSFRRPAFAEAADLALGGRGRILVPPELRRYAGLERDAVVVGVQTHFEVWNPEAWAVVAERVDADANAIAEKLADHI